MALKSADRAKRVPLLVPLGRGDVRSATNHIEEEDWGVFERPPGSGIWWISYQRNGVRKREKVGRKSDALNLYRVRKTELLSGKKLPANLKHSAVNFGALAAAIQTYSETHHKDSRNVTQRLARIVTSFGRRPGDEIEPAEIDSWLTANCKTPATANRYRATFSLLYREAIRNGKLSVNTARLVRQRPENNGRIRFLTDKEEGKLRQAIETGFREHLPEFVISMKTGMRLSEQFGLEWRSVDMDRREINLEKTKNGLARTIPMSEAVFAAFNELAETGREPKQRVFRLKRPRKWFAAAKAAAGITGYRWHDNRHTFCSRLAENGAGISTIMKLAGHKTAAMSARYTHMGDLTLAAEIAKLG